MCRKDNSTRIPPQPSSSFIPTGKPKHTMIAQAPSPTKTRGAERPWLHVISYSFTTGFRVFPSVGPFLRSRCSYQPRISHINLPAQNCLLPSRFDKTSCTTHAKKQLCDASRNHKLLSVTGIQSGLGRQACTSPLNTKCQSNRAKTHTASWFCRDFPAVLVSRVLRGWQEHLLP